MSQFCLIIKEEAAKDIAEAYAWYEMQQANLGERFLSCLEACFSTIDLNPNMFAKIYSDYRQAFVKTFPFVVIYEFVENSVVVYAVFHTSKNPEAKIKRESH